MRIGQGYDIHRLVEGRPLVLGGVSIPYAKGLLGHSDGDVLLHALIDAILGATADGDIGSHFPDTDDRWRNADSAELLASLLDNARGWRIVNVDLTVVAEAPRLAPHRGEIRKRIASLLGIDVDAVSVKAKTNEGLDAVGEGRAIACFAAVLLESREGGGEAWL